MEFKYHFFSNILSRILIFRHPPSYPDCTPRHLIQVLVRDKLQFRTRNILAHHWYSGNELHHKAVLWVPKRRNTSQFTLLLLQFLKLFDYSLIYKLRIPLTCQGGNLADISLKVESLISVKEIHKFNFPSSVYLVSKRKIVLPLLKPRINGWKIIFIDLLLQNRELQGRNTYEDLHKCWISFKVMRLFEIEIIFRIN